MNKMDKEKRVTLFKTIVVEAIDLFGLHDYEIEVSACTSKSYRAITKWHGLIDKPCSSPRQLDILYNTDWLWDTTTTNAGIRKTAYHEVLEVLLHTLREYSNNTTTAISEREVDDAVHRVIRVFENRILQHLPNN